MWVSQVKPSAPLIAICGSKSVCCGSCGNVHHLRPFRPQASGDVAAAPQQRSRMLRPRCPRGLKPGCRRITPRGGGAPSPLRCSLDFTGGLARFLRLMSAAAREDPAPRSSKMQGRDTGASPPRWNTAVAPVTGQGGVRAGRVGGVDFSSRPSALPFPCFPLHLPRRGQPPGGECNGVCPSPVPGSGLKGRAGPTPEN